MLCVCCGFRKHRRDSAVGVVCPVSSKVLMCHVKDLCVILSHVIPLSEAHLLVPASCGRDISDLSPQGSVAGSADMASCFETEGVGLQ